MSRVAHARWKGANVHEFLEIDGKVERLKEPLIHLHNRGIEKQADTRNRYSTLKAQEKFDVGQRANGWDIVFRPMEKPNTQDE